MFTGTLDDLAISLMSAPPERTNGTLTVLGGPEQLAEDLYAVNALFKCLPGFTMPLRMTVIRLPETRDLVVYSPLDPDLVDVSSLGTVKVVVAPNSIHSSYAQRFVAANPGSTLYSSPALARRFPDQEWGNVLDESSAADVISPHVLMQVFSAFKSFQEIVLLHRPTGSLVAADLAFNFPPSERAKMSFCARLFVVLVRGTRPLDWSVTVKLLARSGCKEGLPQLDHIMEGWEWERFVPCHGAVVEKNAKATFRNGVYRYVKSVAQEEGSRMWKIVAAVALVAVSVGVGMRWRSLARR